MWAEGYDKVPVLISEADTIVKLYRVGNQREVRVVKLLVRDDMPTDPYAFSSTVAGKDVAHALQEYQANDEQLVRAHLSTDYEQAHFAVDPTPINVPRQGLHNLHENPGQNDPMIAWVLANLKALRAHPEIINQQYTKNSKEIVLGSGCFLRDGIGYGVEYGDIIEI